MQTYLMWELLANLLFLLLGFALHLDNLNTAFDGDLVWVIGLGQGIELIVESHVGTKLADIDDNVFVLVLADGAWQCKKRQGLFECDILDGLTFLHAGKAWLLVVVGLANLDEGAITTYLGIYILATSWIYAQKATSAGAAAILLGEDDILMEWVIELVDNGTPFFLSSCNLIKFFLDGSGEVVVDDIGEVLQQELVYDGSNIGREEFRFLGTDFLLLGFASDCASLERKADHFLHRWLAVFLDDVLSLEDSTDGRRIG